MLKALAPPLQVVVEGGVVAAKVVAAVDVGKEAVTMAVAMVAAKNTIQQQQSWVWPRTWQLWPRRPRWMQQ